MVEETGVIDLQLASRLWFRNRAWDGARKVMGFY